MTVHASEARPLMTRDSSGKLVVDALVFHSLPPDLQSRVLREMADDRGLEPASVPSAPPPPPPSRHIAGDDWGAISSMLYDVADAEQKLSASEHDIANRRSAAAFLILETARALADRTSCDAAGACPIQPISGATVQ